MSQPTNQTTTSNAPNPSTGFNSASLYVGDLDQTVDEAQLYEVFSAVGPVTSARICRDAETRKSLGYAYVNFINPEDAERAIDTLNFTKIPRNNGNPCRIMWSNRDPALRRSGLGNIFVKNLDKSIDNKSLYDTFSMFGNILSCKVATGSDGESRGYGFVHYDNEESAKSAIENVNGMVINGKKLYVSKFKTRGERENSKQLTFTNVYVKNLPKTYTQQHVMDLFAPYGKVTSLYLPRSQTGESLGFAFANMEKPDQAVLAVEKLNGSTLLGAQLPLYAGRAKKKEERAREKQEQYRKRRTEQQRKFEGANLYVKNLSDDVNEAKLNEMFSKFGSITSAKVMIDDKTGRSRGFGFVCFSNPEEATKALSEMNGRMIDNKPLYVALHQRKEVRRAQLRAQFANRAKMGIPPQMYPPMYLGAAAPFQRQFMYPPQMMQRRYPQGMMPRMPFGFMPMMNAGSMRGGPMRQRGGARYPRGGAPRSQGNRATGQRQSNQQYQYTQNARNQNPVMSDQISGPGPVNEMVVATGVSQPTASAPAQVLPAQQPLTLGTLAALPEQQQKQMIGERLFPLIHGIESSLAGKITGMLLEMDNGELLNLIESKESLREKVEEAVAVLNMNDQQ